ncbi:MAG: hypothetical protein HY651_12450 [Acidobacteria bacterium]|nr:hypothetical protein [Acidobacteriota bacterium]
MNNGWQPVSKPALIAWMAFYGLFMIYALGDNDGFLFIDQANLIVHEAGHLLFGWLGRTPGLWGGTLLELIVPAALAVYFAVHRQTTAAAFAAFFFFENFLYIAVYMADARAQQLPLVTVGDLEMGGHDWFLILAQLGLLHYDRSMAAAVKAAGWLGMLGTIGWLVWRFRRQSE